jgi:hypothetical protein
MFRFDPDPSTIAPLRLTYGLKSSAAQRRQVRQNVVSTSLLLLMASPRPHPLF